MEQVNFHSIFDTFSEDLSIFETITTSHNEILLPTNFSIVFTVHVLSVWVFFHEVHSEEGHDMTAETLAKKTWTRRHPVSVENHQNRSGSLRLHITKSCFLRISVLRSLFMCWMWVFIHEVQYRTMHFYLQHFYEKIFVEEVSPKVPSSISSLFLCRIRQQYTDL